MLYNLYSELEKLTAAKLEYSQSLAENNPDVRSRRNLFRAVVAQCLRDAVLTVSEAQSRDAKYIRRRQRVIIRDAREFFSWEHPCFFPIMRLAGLTKYADKATRIDFEDPRIRFIIKKRGVEKLWMTL